MSEKDNRDDVTSRGGDLALASPNRQSAAARLDDTSVLAAYSRWAPIYDLVFGRAVLFGRIFDIGRRLAVDHINTRTGRVLEVGVGTGISLPRYAAHLKVTGIDLSPDMLAVARKRVADETVATVEDLHEMDAGNLAFGDAAFDTVVVMYTITVVPRPGDVMAEVERVTKPGGEAIFVSHFAADGGWRKTFEDALRPLARKLGWHPDFPVTRILGRPGFEHLETRRFGPFGMFSMVRLQRKA